STRMTDLARTAIAHLSLPFDYLCVIALGSYGRLEAHGEASDFEWLLISDDRHVNSQEAIVAQSALTALFANLFGRERLSVNKTFGQLCEFSDLGTQIGGLAETNRMLTYRILTLTEGLPLSPGDGHQRTMRSLASVYARSHTAGHRMLSLANELARYYRTVRASYKYKVDEEGKAWAVRSIKNRAYRRFAYFSSALHFVAHGPRIDYRSEPLFDLGTVTRFMSQMGVPPVDRLLRSAPETGAPDESVDLAIHLYDRVHSTLASPDVRRHLDQLHPGDRFIDPAYNELRKNCADLQTALANIVIDLTPEPRKELLEMFLL
ncbi:MAG: hypothetical protein ACREA0_09210, partial [bacterium]